MIKEIITKIREAKVLGQDIEVTEEQVLSFLTNKFGSVDELSSFSVIGNMIKMLFVVGGGSTSYTTDIKYVIKNIHYGDIS